MLYIPLAEHLHALHTDLASFLGSVAGLLDSPGADSQLALPFLVRYVYTVDSFFPSRPAMSATDFPSPYSFITSRSVSFTFSTLLYHLAGLCRYHCIIVGIPLLEVTKLITFTHCRLTRCF